jgi:SAM-dependent methyltransferase
MSKGYYLPAQDSLKLRVLDYGCGDGWYLQEMKRRGHSVTGFEADAQHSSNLTQQLGVPVLADPDELQKTHAATFDLVTMHFVVEHLADLTGAFALAGAVLKPGGRFYFMVPNIDSWEAKLFRRKWHGLDPPRHLQFLTPAHVNELAEATGFDVTALDYFSLPNGFAGSLSTVLAGRFIYPLFAALMLPSLIAEDWVLDCARKQSSVRSRWCRSVDYLSCGTS